MLTGSYRKRLDSDLVRWVADGFVSVEGAAAIRSSVNAEGGFKLPGLLGMLGGLLIASSLAAFVAANWEEMPRIAKLVMILLSVAGALALAARLEARGSDAGSDAAATCGALFFGGGIALIGQMYHLPADWPAGSMLVALGALVVAFLLRSNGALIVAFVALTAWSCGRWSQSGGAAHLPFLLLYLPALWLALGRRNRFVHHVAVLALAAWLALFPGDWLKFDFDYGLVAYGLALSAGFIVLGALVLDRGGPPLLTAFMPWGLLGLMVGLNVELIRILDTSGSKPGMASLPVYLAYAAVLPGVAALAVLARDRRFAWPLAGALLLALVIPLVFWSGGVVRLPGKIVVAALVLLIAVALVVSGSAGGIRRIMVAGAGLFGVAILILLWQTVGTLLDQSLFFLVAGAALLALAGGARKMFAKFSKPAGEAT